MDIIKHDYKEFKFTEEEKQKIKDVRQLLLSLPNEDLKCGEELEITKEELVDTIELLDKVVNNTIETYKN